jgi:redox-sensitive bicupin YhaK (pirin superfamily)
VSNNKHIKTMKNTVLHKADTRGHADHGWLNAYHSFSFASWYNPERVQFGALRVLNDDTIAAGMGFGTHPHDNMEIITIPLEGDLAHKDSMGNTETIKSGDVQVMSAGTGVKHSEFNPNAEQRTKLLQIWVYPNQQNVESRYQQITLNPDDRKNKLQQILSPNAEDEGVWIHQDAWFHLGKFDTGVSTTYNLKKEGNGIYAFILAGELTINGQELETRDGFGIWDTNSLEIKANTDAEFLLMEIPMQY